MPPELPNEQELILKKRARRRLVGAVALVLLMVIVLPMILKDRTAPDAQDSIKISMPETKTDDFNSTVIPLDGAVDKPKPEEGTAVSDAPADLIEPDKSETQTEVKPAEKVATVKATEKPVVKPLEKAQEKPAESKKPEPAKVAVVAPAKNESFTVQIGVFSDSANVKQLQDKLKQAGYSSHTEKLSTPKGEKIRLRAGNFNSRPDAEAALSKIKQAGLTGMVMPN
jgi:DedD protein